MPAPGAIVRRVAAWLGIDQAVTNAILSRAVGVLAGPVTLVIVASHLTPSQQGYYYTFGSVLGLTVFVELGVSYVVAQFASHEMAALAWSPAGALEGDPNAKSRLSSLLRSALRWYAGVSALVVFVLVPVGLWFFGRDPEGAGVDWRTPWLLVALATAANCAVTPVFAVLEGCGQVAQVGSTRLVQQVVGTLLLWGTLLAGWGLYASPVLSGFSLLWSVGWLTLARGRAVRDLLAAPTGDRIAWRSAVWPMQWRIAVSWMSGYFIYQLFNPLTFQFRGSIAAGQMGMSLSQATSIGNTAGAWVATKGPTFGQKVALGKFDELDREFGRAARRSVGVALATGAALWVLVAALRWAGHPIGARFLPLGDLALLLVAMTTNVAVSAIAVYLRANKTEPMMRISVVGAALIGSSAFFLGRAFGSRGMMAGYVAASALMLLGTVRLLRARRAEHDAILALRPDSARRGVMAS